MSAGRWSFTLAVTPGVLLALGLQAWESRHWKRPFLGWELLPPLVTLPLAALLLWRVVSAAFAAWSGPEMASAGRLDRAREALRAGADASRRPLSLVLLALLLLDVRILHLSADPPVDLGPSGGAWTDPGEWAHNARNKILYGQWVWDEVNFMYLSPVIHLCFYLVFLLLGIGYAQVGLVSVLFSLATLPIFYSSLKDAQGRGGALLSTLLLGGSYLFIMYSRVGLVETPAVFFQVLTLYCGQRGAKDARFFVLAGLFSLVPLAVKMQMTYIFPAALLTVLMWSLRWPDRPGSGGRSVRPLAYFLGGAAVTLLLLSVLWIIPYRDQILWRLTNEWRLHALPMTLPRLLRNVFYNPFVSYFLLSPVLLLLSGLFLCHLLLRLCRRQGPMPFAHLFAFWWFVGGFSYLAISQYRPLRYYVSLIPPMAILAGSALLALWRARGVVVRPPTPLSVWVYGGGLFMVALTAVGSAYARSAVVQNILAFLSLYPLTSSELAILAGVFALLIGAFAFRLVGPRLPHLSGRLPQWTPRAVAVLLVLLFFYTEGRSYLDWKLHREYKLVSISRRLGTTLPEGSVIAGIFAPILTLENRHRSLAIWDRYGNWTGDPLARFGVTHVAVMAYIDEIGYYQRRFPEAMSRARLLDEWILWRTRVSLYELPREVNPRPSSKGRVEPSGLPRRPDQQRGSR